MLSSAGIVVVQRIKISLAFSGYFVFRKYTQPLQRKHF